MLRDRGRIKWTAMMLPEHVKMLREWQQEEGRVKAVEVDEQQLEEWHYTISESMAAGTLLRIRFTEYEGRGAQEALGIIHHIDLNRRVFKLVTERELTIWIPFQDIQTISQPE